MKFFVIHRLVTVYVLVHVCPSKVPVAVEHQGPATFHAIHGGPFFPGEKHTHKVAYPSLERKRRASLCRASMNIKRSGLDSCYDLLVGRVNVENWVHPRFSSLPYCRPLLRTSLATSITFLPFYFLSLSPLPTPSTSLLFLTFTCENFSFYDEPSRSTTREIR